ncbi:hypothetical protein [Paenibacillus sp. P46E]|uniref:hypothetical protein n=1 Tax=Paenibacillus sp. P46E TaxID=1349436 RepID=UPI00093EADD7|nr:hypothetical protein [Paenibacillus sp. P46E]OKP97067.1 hypothetical protein A3849_17350 [Paenibacillus sp. P46E]
MNKRWQGLLLLVLVVSLFMVTGCEKRLMYAGSSTPHQIKASYRLLSGTDKHNLKLKEGDTIRINYVSKVEKGELTMKLYDPDHKLFKELEANKEGEEELQIQQTGTYKLEIVGTGTKGSYKFSYKKEKKDSK